MVPFLVLVTATLAVRGIGAAGVRPLNDWTLSLFRSKRFELHQTK